MRVVFPIDASMRKPKVSAEFEAQARFRAFKQLHGFSSATIVVDDIETWPGTIRTTAIDVDADRIIVGEIIEP